MPHYFETKVSYDTINADGAEKRVNEVYGVYAETFTDAEARITEEILSTSDHFNVSAVRKTRIAEAWPINNDDSDTKWYKARIAFVHINLTTMQETSATVCYLVQAKSVNDAIRLCDVKMGRSVTHYEIESVVLTPIKEVFK